MLSGSDGTLATIIFYQQVLIMDVHMKSRTTSPFELRPGVELATANIYNYYIAKMSLFCCQFFSGLFSMTMEWLYQNVLLAYCQNVLLPKRLWTSCPRLKCPLPKCLVTNDISSHYGLGHADIHR